RTTCESPIRNVYHKWYLERMNGREKREARRAAARLQGLGRVAIVPRSDKDRLRESLQTARTEDVYEDAGACPDCERGLDTPADRTALCPKHLAKAMGA